MWILLLDRSGDLDAVRAAALAEARRLPPDDTIVVLAYGARPDRVHTGPAGDHDALAAALAAIEPAARGDLPDAIQAAAELIRGGENRTVVFITGRDDIRRYRPRGPVIGLSYRFGEAEGGLSGAGGARGVPPAAEHLEFTAAYPGLLPAADTGLLTVYAHLPSMRAELDRALRERRDELGPRPAGSTGAAGVVARGVELTFRPVFRQLRTTPAEQRVIWDERLEEVRFRVAAAGPAPGPATGQVDVLADGLLIAQLPISIEVTAGAAPPGTPVGRADARMIRDVFASYAHEDEAMVRRCKAAYRALGIRLFVDRDDLLSGQVWRAVLAARIRDCDLVQLYWSAHAAASEHVAEEWRLALDAGPAGFLRPFYWTRPLPPVPDELRDLHFTYLDPQSVGLPPVPRWRPAPAGAEFPAFACVPDVDDTRAHVRRALTGVVDFVEELTGRRYHPPAAVLVDVATTGGAPVRYRRDADVAVGDLAASHGVPAFARPPAGPKVLVAAGALDRLAAGERDAGWSPGPATARAEGLLTGLLVHEHVRAALGRDDGAVDDLAAWARFHFARPDPNLADAAAALLTPGAVRLEMAYRADGPAAITARMGRLAFAGSAFGAGGIDEGYSRSRPGPDVYSPGDHG